MGDLVLSFSMSLDGFIAGPDVSVDRPMGAGGERLHEWMFGSSATNSPARDADAEMAAELHERAGAVILGKRTFAIGVGLWGDTPFPAPSFVLTSEARPPLAMKSADFVFVNDGIASALRQAKKAAGGKDVIVMGANAAQQYLKAGLVDEILIQLVPALLGGGTRLFDHIGADPIELATTRVVESPAVIHLRFRLPKQRPRAA